MSGQSGGDFPVPKVAEQINDLWRDQYVSLLKERRALGAPSLSETIDVLHNKSRIHYRISI
jgi:hypothetical protein